MVQPQLSSVYCARLNRRTVDTKKEVPRGTSFISVLSVPLVAVRRTISAYDHPVDKQENHGAYHGGNEARGFAFRVPAQCASGEACYQGTGHSEQHRHDKSARVVSWHEKLRESSYD